MNYGEVSSLDHQIHFRRGRLAAAVYDVSRVEAGRLQRREQVPHALVVESLLLILSLYYTLYYKRCPKHWSTLFVLLHCQLYNYHYIEAGRLKRRELAPHALAIEPLTAPPGWTISILLIEINVIIIIINMQRGISRQLKFSLVIN